MKPQLEVEFGRASHDLVGECVQHMRITDTGNPAKWATENRWLSAGESPLSPRRTKFTFDATPYAIEPCMSAVDPTVQTTVLWWGSNTGKALALDTPILTTEGWQTMGTLAVGDRVFGLDGKHYPITFATDVMHGHPCYKVSFSDGSEIIADEEHLWMTDRKKRYGKKKRIVNIREVRTTAEIKKTLRTGGFNAHSIPTCEPIDFPEVELPIPSYTLGLWLGDGHSTAATITCSPDDVCVFERVAQDGIGISNKGIDKRNGILSYAIGGRIRKRGYCCRGHKKREGVKCCHICAKSYRDGTIAKKDETLFDKLKSNGLICNKHIPWIYMRAPIKERAELLKGLMDSDGTIGKVEGGAEFSNTDYDLAKQVLELVVSLGMKASITEKDATMNGHVVGKAYRVVFTPNIPVFWLPRKLARQRTIKPDARSRYRKIVSIEPIESVPVRCISVDSPDHLFLAGRSLIATHNPSAVFVNLLGYNVNEAPGGVLWALKTQAQAEEISKKLIAPAIAASPSLECRFSTPKSRDSGNTIQHKLFAGGSLSMIGTESVTGFRANRSPYVIGDEIDSWEGKVGDEGDPVGLLMRRADGFPRSIRMLASTGTVKGHSRIEYWYGQSDMRKWQVPCRVCGERQLILWGQVRWKKGCPETARWHCIKCDAEHSDDQRRDAVKDGIWVPEAPFSGIRGYWLSGFNSLMPPNKGYNNRLHQWAKEITDAAHSQDPKEAKKVLVQTLFCETWQDDEDTKPEWESLFNRREKWEKGAPKEVVVLVAGTDIQSDRIEATLWGFGRGEQMFALEHFVFFGDPREREVWSRLEAAMQRGYPREDGVLLPVRAVGVDTGYPEAQRMAYDFIRPRQPQCWFALKGSAQIDADILNRPKRTTKVDRVTLMTVGGNRAKGLIYDRCTIMERGNGHMRFSSNMPEDWFRQLLVENSYPIFKSGVRYRQFVKPANARNEAIDCAQYALAAFVALGPQNFDGLDAQLEKQTGPAPEAPKPKVKTHSFVGAGGWRI